jgi:adenosine deaminase
MRVTPSEYALIVSAAEALGVSVSEYLRGLCLADRLDHGIDRGYEGALVRYLRERQAEKEPSE